LSADDLPPVELADEGSFVLFIIVTVSSNQHVHSYYPHILIRKQRREQKNRRTGARGWAFRPFLMGVSPG
jgi:hypothetical protein